MMSAVVAVPAATVTPPPRAVVPPVPPPVRFAPANYPRVRRWTCEDLYRLCGVRDDWFHGERFDLIDGEIYEMPAPGPLHDRGVTLVQLALQQPFPHPTYWVRVQMNLPFGINTDPMPDLAVVPGNPRTLTEHPTTAELVVEVADSSLTRDTGDKASLYAAAGIRDYWVADVDNRRLIVFRDPQPDAAGRYGHGYATQLVLGPTDTISPLAAPTATVTVGDLLP